MALYPILMCGGVGSRLWPMSRAAYPKQFLSLVEDASLLEATMARLSGVAEARAPLLVCNAEHRFLTAAQVQAAGVRDATIMLEPEGRNTAPAVALAALHVAATDPAGVLVVLPADHVVDKVDAFHNALATARAAAQDGALVTFGIAPHEPNTGYGYIKAGAPTAFDGVAQVARFVEKPDAETAKAFLAEGGYLWNSGMFVFRADRYLEELEQHAPDILASCRAAMEGAEADMDFLRPQVDAFLACRSESIDYAVMEKSARAAVVPCDLGWSDIGSWDQLHAACPHDDAGNATTGDVVLEDVKGSYIRAEDMMVAAIGVTDLVVVATKDAVLVAPRDRTQDVKKIVEQLKQGGRTEHDTHLQVYRPWGFYESIHNGDRHQVKHIQVTPGARLSLQKHFHRAEHWVVVRGTAIVTRDEEEILLTENQSVYLPLGCVHRLENPGKVPLSIVEVQSGAYLGEDDIVRFEDIYNRVES